MLSQLSQLFYDNFYDDDEYDDDDDDDDDVTRTQVDTLKGWLHSCVLC